MKLSFSKTQYKYLLEMCLIGAYIIEESKIESGSEYTDIVNHILFSSEKSSINKNENFFDGMEEIASTVIDNVNFNEDFLSNYNERNFWRQLAIRMAARDALEDLNYEINEKNYSSYIRLKAEYEKKYIEKFDIDNYNNIELPY